MFVRTDIDAASLPEVKAARRALVFLTNPWSTFERIARHVFFEAAGKLAADAATLGVECFSLEEEADWCQSWLSSLGIPQLGNCPIGAGSIVWLEFGEPASHEIQGARLRRADILARTLELWGD